LGGIADRHSRWGKKEKEGILSTKKGGRGLSSGKRHRGGRSRYSHYEAIKGGKGEKKGINYKFRRGEEEKKIPCTSKEKSHNSLLERGEGSKKKKFMH